MTFNLEVEQEEDGRWLAEVVELPGAMAYGSSAAEAMAKAEALALRALAEQLEHGEAAPRFSPSMTAMRLVRECWRVSPGTPV